MAGTTGLEPATSAVTGQRSNQLSYVPTLFSTTCRKLLNYWLCLLSTLSSHFYRINPISRINWTVWIVNKTTNFRLCPRGDA